MNIRSAFYLSISMLGLLSLGAVSAKDIPGATQTSYAVNQSGAFQFSVPIIVPQGVNGVQPNLALSFSSAQSNGIAGVGWGVAGLSAITRCGKTLATHGRRQGVTYSDQDEFCLDGQPLILMSGDHGKVGAEYRTRIEQFAKVEVVSGGSANLKGGVFPSTFRVYRKDGTIWDYGNGSSAIKLKAPNQGVIRSWSLHKMSDRHGNAYRVDYEAENGRPLTIRYNAPGNSVGDKRVEFVYENRPDVRKLYQGGSLFTFNKRLKSIKVEQASSVIREYSLAYELAPISKLSRVTGVTECGQNGRCMPEIDVAWQSATAGYTSTSAANLVAPDNVIEYRTFTRNLGNGENEANSIKQINRGALIDVDNNGEADMVIAYTDTSGNIRLKTHLRVNKQWQEQESVAWRLPRPLRSYDESITNTTAARFSSDVINMGQFADVNGDGLVDIVYSYRLDTDAHQYATDASTIEDVRETYINTGSGWQLENAWAPKGLIFDYISNGVANIRVPTVRTQLLDINADGLVDWVTAYYDYIAGGLGNEYKETHINNGSGWSRNTNYDMPDTFSQYRGSYSISRGQFVDVNGDGLMDWMSSYHTSTEGFTRKLWLNTGAEWEEQPSNSPFLLPETMFDNLNGWNDAAPVGRGVFLDINGDGLADWVSSYTRPDGATEKYVRLNTGRGWAARNAGFSAPGFVYVNFRYSDFERGWPINQGGQFMDVNQDGLVDYIESNKSSATGFPVTKKAWLNTGTAWVAQAASSPFTPVDLYYDYSGRDNAQSDFGQFVDINSDGSPDWVRTRAGTARTTRLNRLERADQLASITTTMGVTITPTFLPLTDNDTLYSQVPTSLGDEPLAAEADGRFVRGSTYVTASLSVPTPDGSTQRVTSYRYEGAQVSRKYGYLGFRTISNTDSLTGISNYRETRQDFPYIGLTRYSATLLGDSLINSSLSQYRQKPHGGPHQPIKTVSYELTSNISEQYEVNASNLSSGTSNPGLYRRSVVNGTSSDDYGNPLTQTTRIYDGQLSLLHTANVVNEFETADEDGWLIGQVKLVTQTNKTTGKTAKTNSTAYIYKAETGTPLPLGLLETVTSEPSNNTPGISIVTRYSYDVRGNLNREESFPRIATSPATPSRISTIEYDAQKRLPNAILNSLGHRSQVFYDAQCDQPNRVIDANGLETLISYDDFCRAIEQTSPIGLVSEVIYDAAPSASECSASHCQTPPAFKVTSRSPDTADVVQWYNQFNQVLKTSTQGFDINQTINQLNEYDAQGRLASSSQPFFTGNAQYWNDYFYDELSRSTYTELPYDDDAGNRATISYEYDIVNGQLHRTANSVAAPARGTNASANSLGVVSRTNRAIVNALGQVTSVIDADNKALTYSYDSQGSLVQTTDVLGNTITLGYDILGRRTTLNDPDLGTSTYTYNVWGELTAQTDAKNQTINMQYDRLGRLVKRSMPVGSAELIDNGASRPIQHSRWIYDTASGGANGQVLGAIDTVVGPYIGNNENNANVYRRSFTYDTFARPETETTRIRGHQFTESYEYNNVGYLTRWNMPRSGNQEEHDIGVKYAYSNGYLTGIDGTKKVRQGSSFIEQCIEHWRASNYDALGRVDRESVGGLLVTQKIFKPGQNVLERIRTVGLVAGNELLQDLNYTYDANNNLLSRQDVADQSGIETFNYDILDRLRSYTQNGETVNVNYDAIGNITYKSDVGTYQYKPNTSGNNSHQLINVIGTPQVSSNAMTKFDVNWDFDGESVANSLPNVNNMTFNYDNNGSVTYDKRPGSTGNTGPNADADFDAREMSWTAFDKPERIIARSTASGQGTGSLYEYGPEQQRIYKQEAKFSATSVVTDYGEETLYLGKYYERISRVDANGNEIGVKHRYTINTGGHTIQIERDDNSNFDQTKYLLADNLGSTNVIVNAMGEVQQRLAFDPWGMRLNVGDNSQVNSITNRGYTGHEMDDETGLINMNARVYDPYLGRFLSADPVLPDAGDMQSFNRYAYVLGNPLKYTDPTGNCAVSQSTDPNGPCYNAPPPSGGGGGFTFCGGVSGGGVTVSSCSGSGSPFGSFSVPAGLLSSSQQLGFALSAFFHNLANADLSAAGAALLQLAEAVQNGFVANLNGDGTFSFGFVPGGDNSAPVNIEATPVGGNNSQSRPIFTGRAAVAEGLRQLREHPEHTFASEAAAVGGVVLGAGVAFGCAYLGPVCPEVMSLGMFTGSGEFLDLAGAGGVRVSGDVASGVLNATKDGAKIFNIRGVGNLDLSSAGVDRLLSLNKSRLGKKLGAKIGEGRLPFTPGREGFNQALDAVKNTLKNATDVVGPFTGARGRNTVVDIFSSKTGFTVRLRADGTFDTLIKGATPRVR